MTVHLVESVAAEIRAATATLKYPVEYHDEKTRRQSSTWQKVKIFEQYIPRDLFENDAYYPCITVEWLETQDDTQSGSTATLGLTCGVFAKEADGWKDAFHLMEAVRRRLISVRTVANRFRLTGSVTWQQVTQQPTPFYFVYGEATYEIFQAAEPVPLDSAIEPDLITTPAPKVLRPDVFKRRII